MHILLISQYFWPEPFRITDLAIGLVERGHKVTVITAMPNYPQGRFYDGYKNHFFLREVYEGVDIIRIPVIPRGQGSKIKLGLNFISYAISASLIGPLLKISKFDTIFVYEPSPVTVGLPAVVFRYITQKPIMFWVQDLWPETLEATGVVRSSLLLGVVEKLVRFIYLRCEKILVQSRAFREPIERLGIDSNVIEYFPNSAEEFYRPVVLDDSASERSDIPDGFVVMFAGNLGTAQNFPLILDAAELLRGYSHIHWVIFGDGRMRKWLEVEIQKRGLGGCVHLMGRVPADIMPHYFSLADVLLVSLQREPIFAFTVPAKIQSYLACGKPIIASLEGAGADIVKESCAGIVASPGDPDDLSKKVLQISKLSKDEQEAMGARGRKYFEKHFDRERLLDKLDGWLASCSNCSD